MVRMAPLGDAAQGLTSLALREDAGALITSARYPKELVAAVANGGMLTASFDGVLEETGTTNKVSQPNN